MRVTLVAVLALFLCGSLGAADQPPREEVQKALRRACDFFSSEVAVEGGYGGRYSEDLKKRESEGKATATEVWVQPPGTPTIGQTYLNAYLATGDRYYLNLAIDTAVCLVRGQLRSGGWWYTVDFDPQVREQFAYRVDAHRQGDKNITTLDDNTTQAAMRFLMRLDHVLNGAHPEIREAIDYGLKRLLAAQYPNGAWPQRFERSYDPKLHPVRKAQYPKDWPRTFPGVDYSSYYTLNDNTLFDMIDVMLDAARYYNDPKYLQSAVRAGEFLILAQMPDPQPGWAQQYNSQMHPAWARRFEPPAVTGGESREAMLSLMKIYRVTGDKRFLEPIPRALDYYRRSILPGDMRARFYELQTNKPLYFTKKYELTYDDSDLPTHYGFKHGGSTRRLDAIEKEFNELAALDPSELKVLVEPAFPKAADEALIAKVKNALSTLDDKGRWVEDGKLLSYGPKDTTTRVIDNRTFINNTQALIHYLAATGDPLIKEPVYISPSTLPALPPPPAPGTKKISIALVGDSTVTDKSGWGLAFASLLTDKASCTNFSQGGRSSMSFMREGAWAKCLRSHPDYVLIQFGHNDEKLDDPNRGTEPNKGYKTYLTRYIEEARAAGITPILITPLSRRTFDEAGKVRSSLTPYAEAARRLAAEKQVPLLDLHSRSIELYERMGAEACQRQMAPKLPDGKMDRSHLSASGAKLIAPLVADEIRRAVPDLAPYLTTAASE